MPATKQEPVSADEDRLRMSCGEAFRRLPLPIGEEVGHEVSEAEASSKGCSSSYLDLQSGGPEELAGWKGDKAHRSNR
jgi:hypothetical protein